MAEAKTRPTNADVVAFLDAVSNPTRRKDGHAVLELMQELTGEVPVMWGPSIVGFGTHRYAHKNGRPAETCRVGFSPRAQSLVFYLGSLEREQALLDQLGKHRRGSGCLYINRLADIDLECLKTLITRAYEAR